MSGSEQIGAALPAGPQACAFSVVLPAFDEEQALQATLESLRGALRAHDGKYEIIVVDDGSTDATPQILAAAADVTVIHHAENRGYGAALKAGIRKARHPMVVVMDADGTYPVNAIPRLVERCATADMVVGARTGQHVHSTPMRSIAKWGFRQFAQWITGAVIPDLNSGLRVFQRPVAERFMALLPDGFSFTTTITVASLLERLSVHFEPVDYMPRIGRSKIRPVGDTLKIARQLLRLGLRFAPFRTGLPAAILLLLVFAASSADHLVQTGRVTGADLAWLAVALSILAVGLAAEQRVRRRRGVAARELAASTGS